MLRAAFQEYGQIDNMRVPGKNFGFIQFSTHAEVFDLSLISLRCELGIPNICVETRLQLRLRLEMVQHRAVFLVPFDAHGPVNAEFLLLLLQQHLLLLYLLFPRLRLRHLLLVMVMRRTQLPIPRIFILLLVETTLGSLVPDIQGLDMEGRRLCRSSILREAPKAILHRLDIRIRITARHIQITALHIQITALQGTNRITTEIVEETEWERISMGKWTRIQEAEALEVTRMPGEQSQVPGVRIVRLLSLILDFL